MSQTLEGAAQAIDEPLYEVVDGERKELEPMGAYQIVIASELSRRLGNFAEDRKLGLVVTEMLFLLNEEENLQRRPDVAFVPYSRWPEKTVDNSAAWSVVPELAIEVISPTNTVSEIEKKLTEYFEWGVKLVWVIEPELGYVSVYNSFAASRRLKRADTLDGGDVLPGFELKLDALFAVATRPD